MRSRTSDYDTSMSCIVLPCITPRLPSHHIDIDMSCIPENISLADPNFYTPSDIDLLIGADKFWELLHENKIRLPNGPYLQNTKLGWLISGPIQSNSLIQGNIQCNFVQGLDAEMRKFWEVEDIPRVDKLLTDDEKYCEKIFMDTTKREDDGRFAVRIPLKESPELLGDSYNMAEKRFMSLERKLNRLPSYKQLYVEFMREYKQMNHMTEVNTYGSSNYFLPHHGVFRESSSTTKLRVVFDASAAASSGKSLNDIQQIGPKLQNDIFSILLRFRQHRYVGCADVEKMFRQILIQSDMRDLQLILWREKTSDPLKIFQLNTVTYGTASAPYLSMRCLKQLAQDCNDDVIADVINNDFFVDDLITGHDDRDVLLDICRKTSEILKSGCFPLRKWTFSFDVCDTISKELSVGELTQNKTLGLGWLNDTDNLYFTSSLQPNDVSQLTKRHMLSIISQIYDPLGLLSPAVIISKVLIQRLWLCKIGWDEPVPRDVIGTWNQFIDSLSTLNTLRIPRFVRSGNNPYTELHIFTDASQTAYGACAYIRTYNDDSDIVVKLLCAKSKVAPLKTLSIPRLELCGALIGTLNKLTALLTFIALAPRAPLDINTSKLYKKIIDSLRLSFDHVFFWTDSTIVMGWLRMSPHLLKTFVQNRVTEINELTGDMQWLHVSSGDNPADLVSRGLNLDMLSRSSLWWSGPSFLYDRETNWRNNNIPSENNLPEVRGNPIIATTTSIQFPNVIDFEKYSSYIKLKRVFAYVLRFINNSRKQQSINESFSQSSVTGNRSNRVIDLSAQELLSSEQKLARLAQLQSFPDIFCCLRNKLPLKSVKNKKLYNKIVGLNVFLDDNE
ncbi:uncharacterized protein LOC126381259 [Pectinophora gossypiella]|uniref:uncharacterized protein LOC126381259 n=1 Tax=Pectinophora gossypiella TaxID=13191 RepID=UPI00214F1FBD|nr:uncharacterized protein LOC126381259 [Pectinophora gossypiella]